MGKADDIEQAARVLREGGLGADAETSAPSSASSRSRGDPSRIRSSSTSALTISCPARSVSSRPSSMSEVNNWPSFVRVA